MSVVVARMIAKLEAETSQFHGRMTAAEAQLDKWTNATSSGRRGAMMLQRGMQSLAFQLAGTGGAVGQLTSGLLTLGAGGGVAMLAAAAVGSVALAVRGLTADMREGKRAQDEMIQSLGKIGPHGRIVAADLRIAQIERQLREPTLLEKLKIAGSAAIGPAFGGKSIFEHWEELKRERARLIGEQGKAGMELVEPETAARREAAFELSRARTRLSLSGNLADAPASAIAVAEQLRILELEYKQIKPAVAREIAARERHTAELDVATKAIVGARGMGEEAALRRRMIGSPALAITEAMRVRELVQSGVTDAVARQLAGEERAAAASMKTVDVLRTMGPQVAVQSLLAAQQGGIGGFGGAFFPGAAGLLSALPGIGPVAGAGISLVGGLLGNLFSNADKNADKIVRAIERMGQEVGLERVTVVFTGPDGHQIRKSLAELEEGDAVERVPGPVGAGG